MSAFDVIVVGSGNAALCAAIAACEKGAKVLIIEKAPENLAGGNSKYTAGAMRFVYNSQEDLLPLMTNPDDPRLAITDFGAYPASKFEQDLLGFNDGRPLSKEQHLLINKSYETLLWLAGHGVTFDPIYERQSFQKEGRFIFWGGLTLAAQKEGVGLVESQIRTFESMGGEIRYNNALTDLIMENDKISGIVIEDINGHQQTLKTSTVILGCGGFESSALLRTRYMGNPWDQAKVRGTPHNTGDGLECAFKYGAKPYGFYQGCHATPMDLHMKDFGNLTLPHSERKNYRKICYFLGIMMNANGERFVDEGKDFRNYTYAQFGAAILEQPGHFAWQIFDHKITDLLYEEYRFHDAHFIETDTLDDLIEQLDDIEDKDTARQTLIDFNQAVDSHTVFDPTIKDGKATQGLSLPKSNWAQKIDTPPFRAYPVTGGITFTYGGVEVNDQGAVLHKDNQPIPGLYACGEMIGGVFFNGYPGGSGLTSGAVFGRIAGYGAAKYSSHIKSK